MDLYKVHAFGFVNENKNKKSFEINHHCRKKFQEPNENLLKQQTCLNPNYCYVIFGTLKKIDPGFKIPYQRSNFCHYLKPHHGKLNPLTIWQVFNIQYGNLTWGQISVILFWTSWKINPPLISTKRRGATCSIVSRFNIAWI